jgi:hypothetical protein
VQREREQAHCASGRNRGFEPNVHRKRELAPLYGERIRASLVHFENKIASSVTRVNKIASSVTRVNKIKSSVTQVNKIASSHLQRERELAHVCR